MPEFCCMLQIFQEDAEFHLQGFVYRLLGLWLFTPKLNYKAKEFKMVTTKVFKITFWFNFEASNGISPLYFDVTCFFIIYCWTF